MITQEKQLTHNAGTSGKISKQVAQLSQTDCAAGSVSFGRKWKTIFCRQYRSIFNHCDVIGLQSYRIRRNKAK